jgi:hypothetical protein
MTDSQLPDALGVSGFRRYIEIPVHFDLWMQGARTGTVQSVMRDGTWKVRMDNKRVKRLVRIAPEDQAYCKILA